MKKAILLFLLAIISIISQNSITSSYFRGKTWTRAITGKTTYRESIFPMLKELKKEMKVFKAEVINKVSDLKDVDVKIKSYEHLLKTITSKYSDVPQSEVSLKELQTLLEEIKAEHKARKLMIIDSMYSNHPFGPESDDQNIDAAIAYEIIDPMIQNNQSIRDILEGNDARFYRSYEEYEGSKEAKVDTMFGMSINTFLSNILSLVQNLRNTFDDNKANKFRNISLEEFTERIQLYQNIINDIKTTYRQNTSVDEIQIVLTELQSDIDKIKKDLHVQMSYIKRKETEEKDITKEIEIIAQIDSKKAAELQDKLEYEELMNTVIEEKNESVVEKLHASDSTKALLLAAIASDTLKNSVKPIEEKINVVISKLKSIKNIDDQKDIIQGKLINQGIQGCHFMIDQSFDEIIKILHDRALKFANWAVLDNKHTAIMWVANKKFTFDAREEKTVIGGLKHLAREVGKWGTKTFSTREEYLKQELEHLSAQIANLDKAREFLVLIKKESRGLRISPNVLEKFEIYQATVTKLQSEVQRYVTSIHGVSDNEAGHARSIVHKIYLDSDSVLLKKDTEIQKLNEQIETIIGSKN